ncbi:diguanylate cyclase domain-containing protein [Piscinibacter gummiphilus]|uniref:Uncharacterized protein n=1 Tax=Piscinibacter gummiphilus TaxID=946333 RepID=A0A1W6LGH1_9BURK|nr:diguanylate cyclase [Piscinibacter gummiphilus]ARN23310.1 hypothetical protein A4W93_27275 [Piscinibacter gummiphilus]ATU68011.1 hypothetical protein CPZ87_27405 [Piscinibacter gummiphilus]GLS97304.1 hypothetical protein GCM10007918_45960 [Piscinibacter gummiphilus]
MLKHYKRRSLKAKLAFWSAAAMVVVVIAVTSFTLWMLRSDMTRNAADVQTTLSDSIARELDARVADRRQALQQAASVIDPELIARPDLLREHFASRPVVLGLFDTLIVIDREGRITFDTPEFAGRVGRSVADRAYFKEVMATGRLVVSEPLAGRATAEPNIVFAAPIRTASGETVGALGGILYLTRPNFLTELSNVKVGKTGYVSVIVKGETPMIMMHGHRDRVMTPVPPPDRSPLVYRALAGEEGTFEGVNSVGLEALFSFRLLKNVPWLLTTAYPLAEAREQLRDSERQVIALGLGLMVLAGIGIWVLVERLLAPIDHLRAAMVQSLDRSEPVVVDLRDETREVYEVVQAYNTLMAHTHEARAAVQHSEQRLRTIADNLPVLISYVDADERMQFANETYRAWSDVDPVAAIGRRIRDVVSPELYEQRREALRTALSGQRVEFDLVSTTRGTRRHLHTVYVPDVREDGRVDGLYALSTDVTALKEVEAKLNEQARVDPLTGLPNRRAFDERLQSSVARHRRTRQRLALLFLDVDHFKEINDSRGHGTGDEVLCEFARRLLTCVRQTDTVARLAGDEFVIVLEGLKDVEEAVAIAEKIGLLMRLPFHVGDEIRRVTTSIGVAYVDDPRIQAVDIMAKADGALYRAKRNGRNTFAVTTF